MRFHLFILLLPLLAPPAFAQEEPALKALRAYATPGPEHKRLGALAGKWKVTSRWWERQDVKPHEGKGTATMKMILGGRYLQYETSGRAGGVSMKGLGLLGFDNVKKAYESVWVDNMGTGISRATGSFDEATQTLRETGEFTCPLTGNENGMRSYRAEWKLGAKKLVYTMYGSGLLDDGPEFRMVEMVFTR